MKIFLTVASFLSAMVSSGWAQDESSQAPKVEVKTESRDEAMARIDKASIVERLRKAYTPVSIKLDGAWSVTSATVNETWTYSGGKWKCDGSSIKCADWVPATFKFFGSGKGWLNSGGPKERLGNDFQGASRSGVERHSSQAEGEEAPGEEQMKFEGKRNALQIWDWASPAVGSVKISISLRDYLIERIKASDSEESLEWIQKPGAKNLGLEKVFVDRGGEKLMFSRK